MAVWDIGIGNFTFDTDKFVNVVTSPLVVIGGVVGLEFSQDTKEKVAVVVTGAAVVAAAVIAAPVVIAGARVVIPIAARVAARAGPALGRAIKAGAKKLLPIARGFFRRVFSKRTFRNIRRLYRLYRTGEYLLSLFNGLTLDDHVAVTVTGDPTAKRSDLYFLACAAAFGKVKRYDLFPGANLGIPPGAFSVEYDQNSRTIEVNLRYVSWVNPVKTFINKSLVQNLVLVTGPPDFLVGSEFSFQSIFGSIGGIVATPTLPYANKVILTDAPQLIPGGPIITNPKPPGDLRSRGSLYSLVFSALTSPSSAALKLYQNPTLSSDGSVAGVISGG